MLEFTGAQRAFLAETLRDAANVAAGAMVFGQFLSERPFSFVLGGLGVSVWGLLVVVATVFFGRNQS